MEKDSTSFWTDIKKYEDTLAKDPKSYCFAPLSELYRKLGLLDDAISTAKRGVEVHPEYIGGYMALGRAYFEKGMRQEAREALERVAKANPENHLAQKLLSQIFQEEGNLPAAERALRTLVLFNPEDKESRIALEALERSMPAPAVAEAPEEPLSVSPLAEQSGMADVVDSEPPTEWSDSFFMPSQEQPAPNEEDGEQSFVFEEWDEAPEAEVGGAAPTYAPLPTTTLAELFAAQGFKDKALDIYNQLSLQEPENQDIKDRIEALRRSIQSEEEGESGLPRVSGPEGANEVILPEKSEEPVAFPIYGETEMQKAKTHEAFVLETLEKWLYSIRRERECRSGKF